MKMSSNLLEIPFWASRCTFKWPTEPLPYKNSRRNVIFREPQNFCGRNPSALSPAGKNLEFLTFWFVAFNWDAQEFLILFFSYPKLRENTKKELTKDMLWKAALGRNFWQETHNEKSEFFFPFRLFLCRSFFCLSLPIVPCKFPLPTNFTFNEKNLSLRSWNFSSCQLHKVPEEQFYFTTRKLHSFHSIHLVTVITEWGVRRRCRPILFCTINIWSFIC